MAGSVIQATVMVEFEDGLRTAKDTADKNFRPKAEKIRLGTAGTGGYGWGTSRKIYPLQKKFPAAPFYPPPLKKGINLYANKKVSK